MEIYLLDSSFSVCGMIESYTGLVWERRYYETGSFTLSLAPEYFPLVSDAAYVYHGSSHRCGMCECVSYDRTPSGASLTVTGRLLEGILDLRCIPASVNVSGSVEASARTLITQNAISGERAIPSLALDTAHGYTDTAAAAVSPGQLGEALRTFLTPFDMAVGVSYDFEGNRLLCGVWRGLDRTDTQSVNAPALFSTSMENLRSTSYCRDDREFFNFAYIAGSGITSSVDRTGGGARRELYVDGGDIGTPAELDSKAGEALAQYVRVEAIEGEAATEVGMVYGVDYDLGDIVTVTDDELGLSADRRITAVTETWTGGSPAVELTFGDAYTTDIRKIIKKAVV